MGPEGAKTHFEVAPKVPKLFLRWTLKITNLTLRCGPKVPNLTVHWYQLAGRISPSIHHNCTDNAVCCMCVSVCVKV